MYFICKYPNNMHAFQDIGTIFDTASSLFIDHDFQNKNSSNKSFNQVHSRANDLCICVLNAGIGVFIEKIKNLSYVFNSN